MKKWILTFLSLIFLVKVHGQLDPYKYRVGVGIGYTNYYGDLSPYVIDGIGDLFRLFEYNPQYIHDYSLAFSLERRLSSSLGLMLQLGQYDFSMSDRHVNKDGVLRTDLANFDRSLNFRTQVQDAGLSLLFKMDNGKILNKQAFLAPYFTLGAGVMRFQVNGDLLDDQGVWYDYSTRENVNNGQFETVLSALETEIPGGYPTTTFYANLGLGLRFRLARALEFFVQSDFRYAGTDYLDDVSGEYRIGYDSPFQAYAARPGFHEMPSEREYRGANNGHNDLYIFHQIGLKFSLIPSRQAFRASRVSPSTTARYEGEPITHAVMDETIEEDADTLSSRAESQTYGKGDQYFTFIQINPPDERLQSINLQVQAMQGDLGVLQNSLEKDQILQFESRLEDRRKALDMEREGLLAMDTLSAQDSLRLVELDTFLQNINSQLDSTQQRRNYLDLAIAMGQSNTDSLRKLALSPRMEKRDSLAFWGALEQLPIHINRALSQSTMAPPVYSYPPQYPEYPWQPATRPTPSEQDMPEASMGQAPNYTYQFYPQAPLSQGYEQQQWGRRADRQRYDQAPTYRYQAPSQPYRETYDQGARRGNRFFPIFVPRIGSRRPTETIIPSDPTYAPNDTLLIPGFEDSPALDNELSDSLKQYDQVPGFRPIPEPKSPILDSIQTIGQVRVDTLLLEREVLVGLENSKVEVFFEINQFELDESEKEKIAPLAEILLNQPQFYVTLAGFADNTGNVDYNLLLVDRRVTYVKELLMEEYGVEASRISTKPGGLLVRGKSPGSRKEDRKVEIMLRTLPQEEHKTEE